MKKSKFNMTLDQNLATAIRIISDETNKPISKIITDLLIEFREKPENREILNMYHLKNFNLPKYIEITSEKIFNQIKNDGYERVDTFFNPDHLEILSPNLYDIDDLIKNYLNEEDIEDEEIFSNILNATLEHFDFCHDFFNTYEFYRD